MDEAKAIHPMDNAKESRLPSGSYVIRAREENKEALLEEIRSDNKEFFLHRISYNLAYMATADEIHDALTKFSYEVLPAAVSNYKLARAPFENYLNKCLKNHCKKEKKAIFRRRGPEAPLDDVNGRQIELIDDRKDNDIEGMAYRREMAKKLQDCIANLPPKYQEVLIPHLEGVEYLDIANEVGISYPCCRTRVCRAKSLVKECLLKKGLTDISF